MKEIALFDIFQCHRKVPLKEFSMDPICNLKIEGKECSLEFQVNKSNLYMNSCYFRKIIDQDKKLTTFTFSNKSFSKKTYTLYFSEFHAENIPKCQINSDIDGYLLDELLKLNEILQSDYIQEKIDNIKSEKIEYLIQKYLNKRRENHNQDENMILEKLNEKNVKKFLESNLNQEIKIRILSKLQKKKPNLITIIKDYVFNNQNINEEKEDREIYMIIYSKEEIFLYKEKRKFNIRKEAIVLPNIKELLQKEKEKQEKLEKEIEEVKKKIQNLEKSEKEKQEKLEKEIEEMKKKFQNLEKLELILLRNFEEEYQKNSNYQNDRKRFSPLHYAAMKNSKEIGEVLISKGEDINAIDIIYQIIL